MDGKGIRARIATASVAGVLGIALALAAGDANTKGGGKPAVTAFSVRIEGSSGKEVDNAWESCAGGGVRSDLYAWIHETVQGKPWKRTLTIQEITKDGGPGRTLRYLDGFPMRSRRQHAWPVAGAVPHSGAKDLARKPAIA